MPKLLVGPKGGQYYVKNGQKRYVSQDGSQGPFQSVKKQKKIGKSTVRGETHVKAWSPKRNRMYEDIEESYIDRYGYSDKRAKEVAARTVNKYRAEHGELLQKKKKGKKGKKASR